MENLLLSLFGILAVSTVLLAELFLILKGMGISGIKRKLSTGINICIDHMFITMITVFIIGLCIIGG